MPDAAVYEYAKACGIIGKSFTGKRISALAGVRTLNELDRLIFPASGSDLPGRELLVDLEKRIIARTVYQILVIIRSFEEPPELLVHMLRAYEYSDLKAVLQNIISGDKSLPALCDIGRFGTVHFDAYPNAEEMLKNTEFAFLLQELRSISSSGADIASIETKIDYFYYRRLMEYLSYLPAEDSMNIQSVLYKEISLLNCVWALRLRTYFNKSAKDTSNYLINIKSHGETGKSFSLSSDALKSLDFPLDSRQSWEGWKWESFLNKENPNEHWLANPRYFQNAVSQYLYRLYLSSFHHNPMSISSLFCFIKIKQFEEDLLTSVAEGFNLGMDSSGVFSLLEVSV